MQAAVHAVELQAWLADAARLLCRQVVLTNRGSEPATLLHAAVYPNEHGRFMLLDDHGLFWQHARREGPLGDSGCVTLAPGVLSLGWPQSQTNESVPLCTGTSSQRSSLCKGPLNTHRSKCNSLRAATGT